MCDSYVTEVAVSEARSRLADVIEESRRSGEPVSVTRRGRRVAVIIDAETFDRLVDAADDLEDRRELAAAREDAARLLVNAVAGDRPSEAGEHRRPFAANDRHRASGFTAEWCG